MVDSMIAEMKSVTALVEAQCKAGMDENDVKETICRSWISRIQLQTHLRDDHKSALTDAISEGLWDPAQKKLLASTVLASGVKISKSKSVDRRPNQKAHQIENLLPMECMAKLKEVPKYSLASRLSILARSVKALGIENPDNRTLFRLVSIVAYCDPSSSFCQEDTWDHMTMLQKYIKAGGPSKVQYLVDYPPSAVLLPDDIRAAAYAGMEPPELDWKELDQKLADQKVRGERNSKGSRPAKKARNVFLRQLQSIRLQHFLPWSRYCLRLTRFGCEQTPVFCLARSKLAANTLGSLLAAMPLRASIVHFARNVANH